MPCIGDVTHLVPPRARVPPSRRSGAIRPAIRRTGGAVLSVAASTLKAQPGPKMQVLLFTHHERVAAQATDAISSDKLRVHVLMS